MAGIRKDSDYRSEWFNGSKLRRKSPLPQIKKTDRPKPIGLLKSGRGELPLRGGDILSPCFGPG